MVEVLNREEIEKLGNNLVSPFSEDCLTCLGYDLRAGVKVINFRTASEEMLSPSKPVVIPPGERFAVESLEKVLLNENMFAFVFTKVSVLWDGLTSLGTKIDPAFSDNMWLVFANDSSRPYTLKHGQKLCNLMFFRYENPAKEIKPRGRPSLFVLPALLPEISDSSREQEIMASFGYGVSSVVGYFRPRLEKQARKIRNLEKFRRRIMYFVVTILSAVVSGLILWFLTRGGT